MPSDMERLLSSGQVMGWLNISRTTLCRLRSSGVIPYVKVGRTYRYRYSDVAAALETEAHGTGSARKGLRSKTKSR